MTKSQSKEDLIGSKEQLRGDRKSFVLPPDYVLSPTEKKFLLLAERGDCASVQRILDENKGQPDVLNINCTDPLNRSALITAIENENMDLIQLLLKAGIKVKDALLHAIKEEYVEAVELLLEWEEKIHVQGEPYSWEAVEPSASTFTPDITPLTQAAHMNNYEILKILLDRGATLPMPHDVRCGCDECIMSNTQDSLRHSHARINAYKALSSPSLIALSSRDPLLTAFELSWELRRLSTMESEFRNEYNEMRNTVQTFATSLLDHVRTSYELEIMLNHNPKGDPWEPGERLTLERLKLAIKYKQKAFVAHPNVQQLLAAIWYDGLPGFRRKSMVRQMIEVGKLGAMFAMYGSMYMLNPDSKMGLLMKKPFIKFVCHSSSYAFFLSVCKLIYSVQFALLALASQRAEFLALEWIDTEWTRSILEEMTRKERGSIPGPIECGIILYIISLIWREAHSLYSEGLIDYAADLWNIVDFITNVFYMVWISLRFSSWYIVQTRVPTSVEHAVYCYFFNRVEKCLVVAGVNVLRVYRLVPTDTTCQPPKTKFECLAQYALFGNVMCLQSVTLCPGSPDALLLSFSEAKFSLVEYDRDTHSLRTLSLHYFEDEKFKDGYTQHWTPPSIRVDPDGRCVVGLVYGRYFFVLPFGRTIDDNVKSAYVMPSYTIPISAIDSKMNNILDFDFLHGYYEPTLLILYEPVKTFAGRIAVRKDTCAMVAISLNIQQHVHPVIWSLDSLPYDCQKVIAVARPIGGVLIMAVNSLIYLNQSVPPFGVALNSIAKTLTNFPLGQQEDINLVLDRATATFMSSDKLVTSLCNGDLYVITLYADSMRAVRSFHFEKCASSVLTTCITVCLDSYLFLGSRLGNSLLLRYYARSQSNDDEPTIKRKRADETDEDLIELEVYGSEVQTSICLESYSFEVCDSIINIGPCSQASLGEPAYISDEFISDEHNVELLCTSGHGKNGALSVLHRSIKPQLITTFHLHGYKDMWTVHGENDFHTHMILTNADSTLVLQTGQEINELDSSGFATREHTVYVCNMSKFVVQVLSNSVRLLNGSEQLQSVPLEFGSPIVHGSSCYPYVVLLTDDGQVVVLTVKSTGRILLMRPTNFEQIPHTKTLTVYRDVSGLFSSTFPLAEIPLAGPKLNHDNFVSDSVEDEEEMLYGDTIDSSSKETPHISSVNKNTMWWLKFLEQPIPTYWVILTRDNGYMEIYTLPDFKIKYRAANLDESPMVLKDSLEDNCYFPKKTEIIKEILVVPLGYQDKRPIMFVRMDNEVVIYGVHRHPEGTMKMRFHKMTSLLTFQSKSGNQFEHTSLLRYFNKVAGYNGVFICGQNPHLILLTVRGELRCHPLHIDGPIICFAPFHNVNCSQGFLYFNSDHKLRISILPTHLSYDEPWPLRKVPLRKTPHFIAYHLETKTYCVVTSSSEPSASYYRFNGEDKELTTEERDPLFPLPSHEVFTLELFSPASWEPIPDTSIETEDWEHITCLKNVALAYEGARSGLKGYIAMGTNYSYSEDITSRGRIFLFDIIDVVPEPGKPLTKNKIKMIYAKEQKGPVTAITHVVGFLVTAVGQKIYIWQLKDNDLIGIAFIDTEVYVHQMLSIKSLILVADLFKSITLLRFQEEYRTLSLVCRDAKPLEVFDINFLIDNTELGFLASDREQNLLLYLYQPMARESYGGQHLIRRGDFNIGSNVNTFFRLRCKQSTLSAERQDAIGSNKRHVTMYTTLDGSIGYIVPIHEKNYRRLLTLQNMLVRNIAHLAGLNPKAYRSFKGTVSDRNNQAKRVIDGDLVWMYVTCLNARQRNEIANKVGVKTIELLQDIYELDRTTWHF